jgi:cytochrome c oxidase subunit 2
VFVAALALTAAGCGAGDQSTLDPASRPARLIRDLWWWMQGVAWVVFGGAVALLLIAWFRRRRAGLPIFGEREPLVTGLVVVFGIVIPILTLAGLFTVANVKLIGETNAPAAGSTAMTVQVVGHQWFWEVRYPGTDAVTANEIHIPVGTRVNLVATTADVIHSFWVPRLNRKIDMIPGRTNRILLEADEPGRYRGQCAEFCGLQHAHMGLVVVAPPRGAYESWLRNMESPAPEPADGEASRGRDVFLKEACAQCHTIRGTSAQGRIGPDLTHLASRETLAALTIPNTRSELADWIRDPQHAKPGNRMPGLRLSDDDVDALVAYLESLR